MDAQLADLVTRLRAGIAEPDDFHSIEPWAEHFGMSVEELREVFNDFVAAGIVDAVEHDDMMQYRFVKPPPVGDGLAEVVSLAAHRGKVNRHRRYG